MLGPGRTMSTLKSRPSDTMAAGAPFKRFVFLGLALVLFFMWIGAFVVFHIAAALIHLLLVLAVWVRF